MAIQLKHKKILLLFADLCEAKALLEKIPFQQTAEHVYHTNNQQLHLDLCILPTWGPAGVYQALRKYTLSTYDLWINLGFAGSCQPSLPLMQIFSIDQVHQLDAFIPTQRSKAPSLRVLPTPNLPLQILVSAHQPYTHGFHDTFSLVDMEGYTIATYAKHYGIPCMMIKIVSDYTEPSLRKNFHAMKDILSHQISQQFIQLLPYLII